MSMRSFFLLFPNLVAVTTAYSVVPSPSALPATFPGDVDLEAAYAASDFCIAPAALILRAKDIITNRGIGLKDGGACLAEDFVFRAQFVEVDRKGFVGALDSFNLEDSFVISQSLFGWTVDPTQPNRVWFLNRQEGAFTGSPFQGVAPTGETIVLPPQTYHMDFNTDGQVTEFGFYTADRNQGTTGGLGGAFAFFYAVGKPLPFPEGRPYEMSWQRRVLEFFANRLRPSPSSEKRASTVGSKATLHGIDNEIESTRQRDIFES